MAAGPVAAAVAAAAAAAGVEAAVVDAAAGAVALEMLEVSTEVAVGGRDSERHDGSSVMATDRAAYRLAEDPEDRLGQMVQDR